MRRWHLTVVLALLAAAAVAVAGPVPWSSRPPVPETSAPVAPRTAAIPEATPSVRPPPPPVVSLPPDPPAKPMYVGCGGGVHERPELAPECGKG